MLFVLALLSASTLFLAASTRSQPMVWVSVGTIVALFGYVCVLGQLRQRALLDPAPAIRHAPSVREAPPAPRRTAAPAPTGRIVRPRQAPQPARGLVVRRPADRWSHAV